MGRTQRVLSWTFVLIRGSSFPPFGLWTLDFGLHRITLAFTYA